MPNRFAFIIGIIVLAMPGCMYQRGYYPNGYYGPGPSVLPAQPWTGYPSGPIYQPGGPVYQPGAPGYQPGAPVGGTYPTPIDGSSPYVPANPGTAPAGSGQPYAPSDPNSTYGNPPGGPTSAPLFNANPGTSGGGVPNPGDDDFNRQPGAQRPTITPTSGARNSNDLSTPFGQQDSTRMQRNFADPPVVEADSPFETPVIQTAGNGGADVRFANQQTESSPASTKTYANDPQFEWVQGVVEYDDISNTWVIMYNDNPRTSDQYGGELTLADDPSLARFRTGDVVRIYGSLDQSERDSRKKPMYRMTKAQSLKSVAR